MSLADMSRKYVFEVFYTEREAVVMDRACLSKIILKPALTDSDLPKSEEAHLAKSKSMEHMRAVERATI